MVVQPDRVSSAALGRIERGQVLLRRGGRFTGVCGGGSAAVSGGGAATSGAGYDVRIRIKMRASGSSSKDGTPCADDIAMMPGDASAEGVTRDASSGRAGSPQGKHKRHTETPKTPLLAMAHASSYP